MRIALIGMAGIGKSTWAARLERAGFRRFDCDRMIADRLSPEVAEAADLIAGLGAWMGLPWESGYEARAEQYHRLEKAVMTEVLGALSEGEGNRDVVVDTAGSVIYTGEEILAELSGCSVIVHLSAPPQVRRRLLQSYLERPGPVLWHGMFRPEPGEPPEEAIRRCYERLLNDRERRYARWANVSIPHGVHREGLADAASFLDHLRVMGSGLES